MSLATPTTQGLSDTIVAQLEGSIEQTLPLLPKAFIRVLAKVLAGVFILLWKYVGSLFLNQFVQYASWKETEVNGKKIRPLIEWGRMLGVGDPDDGARAELTVQITVLSMVGTLAAQQQLVKPPTGVIYLGLAPVTLDAPTKTLLIRAYSDPSGGGGVGAIGNLAVGQKLEFARALGNVAQEVTVTAINVVGAAAETESSYRARVLKRKQRPPQGGAYADYEIWGNWVAGVANIYPYAGAPGEIDVYVECDAELEPDGFPSAPMRSAVGVAIQLYRPVNHALNVFSITRRQFTLVVTGLDVADQTTTRAALTAGVDQYLRTREPFILGLSVLPRRDRITQAGVAGVVHEIVAAAGGLVQSVALYRDALVISAHTLAHGEKAKLAAGGITYP